MPGPPAPEQAPRILPTLILGGLGVLVAITIVGWVIGAILAMIRLAALIVIAIAVIWAIVSMRSDR